MLEGIQGISPEMKYMVQSVRDFMRDFPELNRLIDGEESNDRLIIWSIIDAVDDFNGTPPITYYSLANLLSLQQGSLLRSMSTAHLLTSVGLLQTRNHINYSAGGTTVGINDKTPLLFQWINMLKSFTEQRKMQVKVGLNISSLFGEPGVHSELWAVNSSYIGW